MSLSYEQRMEFLFNVETMVKNYPELLNDTIMACTNGMQKALDEESKRATDMELVAVGFQAMSQNKRYTEKNFKWATGLVASKLVKWEKHSRVNWGQTQEELNQIIEDNKQS